MIENNYSPKRRRVALSGGEAPADQTGKGLYLRLIGQNPDLVMHGGGNTSVKFAAKTSLAKVATCCMSKDPVGIWTQSLRLAAGLWLDPLRTCVVWSNCPITNGQCPRSNLLDSTSPNPQLKRFSMRFYRIICGSSHVTPFLILANLPDAAEICKDLGLKLGIVPYIAAGTMAKKVRSL